MPWPGWRLLTALAFALCNFAGPGQALAQAPLAPSAQAPDQQPKQVLFDFEMFLAQTLAPGLHYYAFQQKMKSPFDLHDTDRDGAITDADRQRSRQRFETMLRAQYISLLLQADLNSDGVITRDELSIFARYSLRPMRGGLERLCCGRVVRQLPAQAGAPADARNPRRAAKRIAFQRFRS